MNLETFMELALYEACVSINEGNNGFGAVIVKNEQVIASSHDTAKTNNDPTEHAEINVIRAASKLLGSDLSGCIILSTHEPCPMCSTALLWSGINEIAYGQSIEDSLLLGHNGIDISCKEIFDRAKTNITIHQNVLKEKCSLLYLK